MNKHVRWTLISVVTIAFAILFMPFFVEILTAAIFAFALDPFSRRLAQLTIFKRFSIYFRRKIWVAITVALLVLAIVLPITFAVNNVYESVHQAAEAGFQNSEFYQNLVEIQKMLSKWANHLIASLALNRQIDLHTMGGNLTNQLGQLLVSLSGKFVANLPQLILSVFVFCSALYYFMAEQKQIKSFFLKTDLIQEKDLNHLSEILQKSCVSTLFVSVVVGCVQAGTVAIGSAIFKFGDFIVIFVATFFLSFVPVVGAAPVALFLSLLGLVQQEYATATGFLVIALFAGSIDNILRAYLVGSGEDLHPVVVLLAIIGSIIIFGLAGLFIGPVLATTTAKIYKAYVLEEGQHDAGSGS